MYDARYKQILWKREKLAGMSLKRAHQSAVVFWQFVVVAWNQRANTPYSQMADTREKTGA